MVICTRLAPNSLINTAGFSALDLLVAIRLTLMDEAVNASPMQELCRGGTTDNGKTSSPGGTVRTKHVRKLLKHS